MKITAITLAKEEKKGLPNFSNVTASMSITIELGENEKPNLLPYWEAINQQIKRQLEEYANAE